MSNFKIVKVFCYVIVLIFFISYVHFSFFKPPIYSLSEGPSDVFYYLVYGREASSLRFFSWNGLYPSNGFHPLWLIFVSLSFSLTENLAITVVLQSLFLLIFFIISIWYLYKITKIFNDKFIQIISLFIFALLGSQIFFWYMESALSLALFFGYVYYVVCKYQTNQKSSISDAIIIGIISSLIALSRLDLILLVCPIHGFLILNSLKNQNFKLAGAFALPPILIVGSYILLIFYITGSPVPLSGVVKSSFPYIFRDTEWSQLLIKQTKYGIVAIIMTFLVVVCSDILLKFKLKDSRQISSYKVYLNVIYLLLLGAFFHVAYHISFSGTGTIGRWYFVIHLNLFVLAISIFLYSLKNNSKLSIIYNYFYQKKFQYLFIIMTIPSIFYFTIYSRMNYEYKKTESYAVMKFVEILEKKNFNKNVKIYDGTDGSFAFFSKIPSYHTKGMAATPDYVFQKKKLINQFGKLKHEEILIKNFLINEKIDYVLLGRKLDRGTDTDYCIRNISDYHSLESDENLSHYYYLLKAKIFLQNSEICSK